MSRARPRLCKAAARKGAHAGVVEQLVDDELDDVLEVLELLELLEQLNGEPWPS